jgi:dihydropyrimidinase
MVKSVKILYGFGRGRENANGRLGGFFVKILFQGGTVVSGKGTRRADVLVENEKVLSVAHRIDCDDAQVRDVTGMLLFPGFIDAHTHFDLDVCNTTTADDFTSGSRAAVRGGTTTVIDFACPNKGETLHDGLALWHRKADGRTYCDYGFHMTIDDWNETIADEIDDMYAEGISSFKMYMAYPAMMIGDENIYRALKKLKEKGGICGVHCENNEVIHALVEDKVAAGEMGVGSHPRTRPAALEAEAVSRLLHIAQVVDIPVIIVHLTNEESLREVEAARKRGQKVYVETCPQYLLLDDSVYDQPDYDQAARFVCAPPIRTVNDQKVLWRALRRGEIQTISTDHCSFTLAQKEAGRGDFTKIPGGVPGVETRGELIYSYGVTQRRISLATMCKVLSENPAKLYGMYPRKGVIAPGSDADLVIYDPQADKVLRGEDMVGAAGYTPFEGFVTRGSIAQVYLRGQQVVDHGTVVAPACAGKYIARGKCAL